MKTRLLLPAVLLLLSLAGTFAAPEAKADDRAREALADRDYARAVSILREVLSAEPESPRTEEREMLLVRGLSLAGENEEVVRVGLGLLSTRPESRYRSKVAFLTARGLLALGRGEEATGLLTETFDRMTSAEVRAHIAGIYLRAADAAFEGRKPEGPFDPGVPPDYAKALRLYEKARQAGIPPAKRFEARLRHARAACEMKDHDRALKLLGEVSGEKARNDPRRLFLMGRALLALNRRAEAEDVLDRLVAEAPASKEAPEALLLLSDPDRLDRLVREYPDHERAPEAAWRRGVALAKAGDVAVAVNALLSAAKRFPASPWAAKSLLAAADALFAAKEYDRAQVRYDEYLRRHPESPDFAKVRERLTAAWFHRGRALREAGETDAAAKVWAALRNTYPLSPYAPRSLSEEAAAGEGDAALAPLRELVTRYPDAPEAPAAALRIGLLLAKLPGRMADAVAALRRAKERYGSTEAGKEAARRLAQMRAESIEVELKAPLRPGDSPILTLRTRNLEKVTGRVYRIDPEAYFRKHAGFEGIQDVFVDVIAPDGTFEHEVPGYEAYREIEEKLPVPVTGEGAWIVTVEGGTLRATGLLLVSGIDFVVKESPTEALLFVTDAAGGNPVPGATILASERGRVRTVTTGPDGTARIPFRGRSTPRSFLAVRGESVAVHGFPGLSRKLRGFQTTVHLATDRTVYRPGHEVKFRAVVRERSGSWFRTPAGAPVRVSVTDGVGNELFAKEARLSDFGTVAGSFRLPEDLPPRLYAITVRFRKKGYSSDFRVKAYRKPTVFLDVRPERPVFLRGETVAFTVGARYSFGQPLVGHPLDVVLERRVAGRRTGTPETIQVVTGKDGTARITRKTTPGPDMEIAVTVSTEDATHRSYTAGLAIPVAETGYVAALEADRPRIYLGEAVHLVLRTTDRSGNPVAASGRIVVTRGIDRLGDPIQADTEAGGRLALTWEPDAEGTLRFTYEGEDRAGRTVRAVTEVVVVRAESAVTVRLDTPEHRVGDRARVTVTAPAPGGPALLTLEGESILGHRVVRLTPGRNDLEVEILPGHVPNLWISASRIVDRRLMTGSDAVTVRETLSVEVEPERREYGPGDLCRLTVRTRDGKGNPVSAEVAVGVVDEALYRLYPDTTPTLAATFTPPTRAHLVRTAASTAFSFRGITSTLSPDLLAERERRRRGEFEKGILLEEEPMVEVEDHNESDSDASIGIGGGAGGAFGGRGGHRNLRAAGGGRRTEGAIAARRRFEDTAFFKADVVTGEDGEAELTFRLPEDLTEWRITARGASRGNGFGEVRAAIATTRDLVLRPALPRFLRAGDVYTGAAGVVNGTGRDLDVDVTLDPAEGGPRRSTLSLAAGREAVADWPLGTAAAGEMTLVARAAAAGITAQDAVERKLPVLPYGVPWRTGVAGLSSEGGAREFALPADVVSGTVRMRIHVAPSVLRAALDGVAELMEFPYGCTEQTVNRILPALALAKAIRELGLDERAALPELGRIVRAGALRLTYLQQPSGLWGWWKRGSPDAEMTAYALLALAAAREAGVAFSPNVLPKAGKALPGFLEKIEHPDRRAFLLYAKSRAFGVNFAELAAPFEDRERLSLRGRAFLALAYETLGETEHRSRLLEEIETALTRRMPASRETLGFVLSALAGPEGAPRPMATEAAATLARGREARGFGTTRETGAAVLGIARLLAAGHGMGDASSFTVRLNGKTILEKRLEKTPAGRIPGGTFALPADGLEEGLNRLEVTGSGVFFYAVEVFAVCRKAPEDRAGLAVTRRASLLPAVSPAAEKVSGLIRKDDRRGQPDVDRVKVGEMVRVTLRLSNPDRERYVVVEDPLPAGFEVIGGTERGPFTETLRFDDRVVFFLENPEPETTVSYVVRGEGPGRVRVPPAVVYAMYRPANAAWSAERTFTVFRAGEEMERDPALGLSAPDLFRVAERAEAAGDFERAAHCLKALADRFPLTRDGKIRVLRRLARVRSKAGDPAGALAAWYRLKAEVPGVRLEVADERRIAADCVKTGRHGDAALAFERAASRLIESDLRIPKDLGKEARRLTIELLEAAPFLPVTEEAWPKLLERTPGDLDLPKVFLARYPESRFAPSVTYRLLRTLLDRGEFDALEEGCRRFTDRYPDHQLRDDVDWLLAYSLFAQERYDEADAAAEASLSRTYRTVEGRPGPSQYVNNLIHLRAQVAHIRGDLDRAAALYHRVAGFSTDAAAAYAQLTEVRLEVPEVIRRGTGEKAAIPIRAKNLAAVTYRLYPIDLLVYFVLVKDASRMAALNLDGIVAAASGRAAFSPERRMTDHEIQLPDLEPGVYLVLLRAGKIERRGVLIVSDLTAEIQSTGRSVRVIVTRRDSGRPVGGARVLVAADGRRLVGDGLTDARGIFRVKGGFSGVSAVATKDGQCALAGE